MSHFESALWSDSLWAIPQVPAEIDFIFQNSALPPGITFSRPSSGWRFDSQAALVEEAPDTARLDYGPLALHHLGLLIEPQRVNSAPLSSGRSMFNSGSNITRTWAVNDGVPKASSSQFSDDFERPDTADGDIGNGWDLRGEYVSGYPLPSSPYGRIESGRFVADVDQVVYASRLMGSTQTRMRATVSWVANGGVASLATATLIISPNDKLIDTMLHITVNRATAKIQKRIAGGAFVDLGVISFVPSLSYNTSYEIAVDVVDNEAVLSVAGQSVATAIDNDIRTLVGPYVVYEIYQPEIDMVDKVRFESVSNGESNLRMVATQTALNGQAQRNITVPNDSATHTISVCIPKSGVPAANVLLQTSLVNGTAISESIAVNPQTGEFTGVNGYVFDYGAFWRLVKWVTNNSSGNTVLACIFNPAVGQSAGSYEVSDLQVEVGAPDSSYLIPTAGSPVTRAADVATTTLANTSDVLVQDRGGGLWISGVPAGPYTLVPRPNQRHITRWRAFPAGTAAANPGMAVAYP